MCARCASAGEISVLMITHKFREVTAFADDVSVLRRGKQVGSGQVADLSHADMAAMMIGAEASRAPAARNGTPGGAGAGAGGAEGAATGRG